MPSHVFSDINGSPIKAEKNYQYFYEPVYWAADKGIVKGLSDGSFGIDNPCTRRQFLIMLWRYSGKPKVKNSANKYFKDIPSKFGPSTDSNQAIAWGYETGISKGYKEKEGKRLFKPDDSIIIKSCITMLYRISGSPEVEGNLSLNEEFHKKYNESTDTYKAILWALKCNLLTSDNLDSFIEEECKRKDIVTFIYKTNDYIFFG